MTLLRLIAAVGCTLVIVVNVAAEDAGDVSQGFEPPPDSEFDWIQLTSGEWLKGEFKVLYDYTVEFDSAKLNLLELKLKDVRQIRTCKVQALLLETHPGGRETLELRGRIWVYDDKVLVYDGAKELEFKRSEIVTMAAGVERGRDLWSGSVSIGINARGGNTETTEATFTANLQRHTAHSRLNGEYVGTFGKAGSDETANNHRVNGAFDRFLAGRFFWRIIDLQYYRDPFSNIDSQYSLATASGYDLVRTASRQWEFICGAGYQSQEFVSVEADQAGSEGTPFFLAGTRLDARLTGKVDLLTDYVFRILNERSGSYTHHALARLSTDITRALDIHLSFIWDRVQTPQATSDGNVPEQDDFQLVFSFAHRF